MSPATVSACEMCGGSMVVKYRRTGPLLCLNCGRRERRRAQNAARRAEVRKPVMPAHEINRLAREAGMTYCKYVAMMQASKQVNQTIIEVAL